ncbi:TetR/AcrR family transcriptional regulator [Actinomadura sp. ATCC 31491]|uniref:TetR/AcrR family transcriptional regulator n=1 Tax=Actinomadura luzonensis TaxID=2805427 RepID=A0ABT0FUP9_9ACTN|nr:TetR/AcrR family transcriptional regulator [Actinomadura luzonensis]MCK2216051.1 TetR/AcrR family transcriptional regulator [Actinomadura luzonensis]
MAVSARRGTPLSIDEICAAALRLVDEGGVEGLSMRKLAAELDVNPMSLYHHVASKDALLELICATAASRMSLPPDDGTPWQEQLRALALAYHRHARLHPALWIHVHNHPRIIADRRLSLWQVLERVLRLAGVPEEELRRTSDVLHAFVSGIILAELQGHLPDDPEETGRRLATAVELIVRGLEGGAAGARPAARG